MSAFCSKCGTALPPAARFCSVCGTVVSGAQPGEYGAYSQPFGRQPFAQPYYPARLTRPFVGRQFAGVCAGFARTYGWDVSLVRILTVVGGIFLFPVVEIVYVACWIGIPEGLNELPPPPPVQQV